MKFKTSLILLAILFMLGITPHLLILYEAFIHPEPIAQVTDEDSTNITKP